MTRDELLFHQLRLSALGRHVEAIELAEADAEWRRKQAWLRVERRCQKAMAEALLGSAPDIAKMNEPSTPDAPIMNEPSTVSPQPMQADAPTYGPARTMFLAQEGLRHAGLSPTQVLVAQAILSFHNGRTGRCDAGFETIADRAGLGRSKAAVRAVRRAVSRLDAPRPRTRPPAPGARLEKPGLGLILSVRHGGSVGHANRYLIQWDRLVALASGGQRLAEPSTVVSRPHEAVEPSTGGPQTRVHNQKKVVGRSVRAKEPDRTQRELPLMVPVSGGLSAGEVARRKAAQRLMQRLDQHLSRFGLREADRMRGMLDDAVMAEAQVVQGKHGDDAGFAVLLDAFGPGPPAAMPEVSEALRKRLG